MFVNVATPSCQAVHVDVRAQHCRIGLLLPLLDGFCKLNLGHWAFAANDFYSPNYLSGSFMIVLNLIIGS